MNCLICNSNNNFEQRSGKVRDNHSLKIIECSNCGLVFLEKNNHITNNFYENSKMCNYQSDDHILKWIKSTRIDDTRRY